MIEEGRIKALGWYIIKGVYTQAESPFNLFKISEEKDFIIKGVKQLLKDFNVKVDMDKDILGGDILDIKVEKEDDFYNAVVNFVLGLSIVKKNNPNLAKDFIEKADIEQNKLPGIIKSLQKKGKDAREEKRELEGYTQYVEQNVVNSKKL